MTEPSKLPHHGVPEHQPAAGGIAARARAAAGPQYLNGLNPEQREAVETLDGPVLVLAGASIARFRASGSGRVTLLEIVVATSNFLPALADRGKACIRGQESLT